MTELLADDKFLRILKIWSVYQLAVSTELGIRFTVDLNVATPSF